MQTFFTDEQLQDGGTARANEILRSCVHCGFCTATCPTYQLLGDELDGPRGRIYLIKDMLENARVPDAKTVLHVDRCLSCLSCMNTCPSGVHYMHLIDHARAYIATHYQRPLSDRALRFILKQILPYPMRFRVAMLGAWAARPFKRLLPGRLKAMVEFAPRSLPPVSRMEDVGVHPAVGTTRYRVALMTGCAQKALDTDINEATIRLLTRHGCEVVIAKSGCCGALTHHMGDEAAARASAARNIRAWQAAGPLDAVIINTSGCGTTVKDYGHLMHTTPLAAEAKAIAARAKDITEWMSEIGFEPQTPRAARVTYHPACSLSHGQQVKEPPLALLRQAGFSVRVPAQAHLCCGSAGTYNLLQPEIARQLQANKVTAIEATEPEIIAAGNIGCMMQIGSKAAVPVVHTAELLDWASGGPKPRKLGLA